MSKGSNLCAILHQINKYICGARIRGNQAHCHRLLSAFVYYKCNFHFDFRLHILIIMVVALCSSSKLFTRHQFLSFSHSFTSILLALCLRWFLLRLKERRALEIADVAFNPFYIMRFVCTNGNYAFRKSLPKPLNAR